MSGEPAPLKPTITPRARIALSVATVLGMLGLCGLGGTTLYFLGVFTGTKTPGPPLVCAHGSIVTTGVLPRIPPLVKDQVYYAAIIIKVGQDQGVPRRGWVIAIATALQESQLHNLPNLGARNDHDSIGLFQQRPSQGWGTPEQITDPVYAAGRFYQRLVTVHGWQNIALTDAAQAVQRSGYPNAYAKHETLATQIVNTLASGTDSAGNSLVDIRCTAVRRIAAPRQPALLGGTRRHAEVVARPAAGIGVLR